MNFDSFFSTYILGVLRVVRKYYDTLDSITFRGISVLDYCITLVLISVVVPMVITLVRSGVHVGYDELTYSRRKEREIKRDDIHEKKRAKAQSNVNRQYSRQDGRRVARALKRGIRRG